jgi:hypothetical protein
MSHDHGSPLVDPPPSSAGGFAERRPDWRMLDVQRLLIAGRQVLPTQADATICRAATVLARRSPAGEDCLDAIGQAIQLGEPAEIETASLVEALCLARFRPEQIAERVSMSTLTVATYLQLRFAVDTRRQSEHFIWQSGIRPELQRGDPATARGRTGLKILASFGGGDCVERLLGLAAAAGQLRESLAESLQRRAAVCALEGLADLCGGEGPPDFARLLDNIEKLLSVLAKWTAVNDPDNLAKIAPGIEGMVARDFASGLFPMFGAPPAPPSSPAPTVPRPAKTAQEQLLADAQERFIATAECRDVLNDVAGLLDPAKGARAAKPAAKPKAGRPKADDPLTKVSNVEQLIRKYPSETLLATGCFKDDKKQVVLLPSLTNAERPPVVFRDGAGGVSAIAAEDRPAAALTVLELLLAATDIAQRLKQGGGALLVAWTPQEALAWHQRGFAAAPIGELNARPPRRLQQIACYLDAVKDPRIPGHPGSMNPTVKRIRRHDVLLVAPLGHPVTGTPLPEDAQRQVVEMSRRLFDSARDAWGGLGFWTPPAACFEHKGRAATAALCASLERDLWLAPPQGPTPATDAAVPNRAAAREQLVRTASAPLGVVDDEALAAAQTAYVAALEAELVAPLLANAARSDDPAGRALWNAAAAVQTRHAQVEAELLATPRRAGSDSLAAPTDPRHEEMRSLEKQLLSLVAKAPRPSRRQRRSLAHGPH